VKFPLRFRIIFVKTAEKFADIGFFHSILLRGPAAAQYSTVIRGNMPSSKEQMEEEGRAAQRTGAFFLWLHPNNSLSRSGFIILMCLIAGFSFFYGLYCLSLGAWPIFGFCGLDVLVVYIAFRFSFREV